MLLLYMTRLRSDLVWIPTFAILVAFAVPLGPAAGPATEMIPAVYVTVGAGLGLPLFGSLARAVVT